MLAILVLFVLLVLFLLFSSFRFRFQISKDKERFVRKAYGTWLLGMMRFRYDGENEKPLQITFLWKYLAGKPNLPEEEAEFSDVGKVAEEIEAEKIKAGRGNKIEKAVEEENFSIDVQEPVKVEVIKEKATPKTEIAESVAQSKKEFTHEYPEIIPEPEETAPRESLGKRIAPKSKWLKGNFVKRLFKGIKKKIHLLLDKIKEFANSMKEKVQHMIQNVSYYWNYPDKELILAYTKKFIVREWRALHLKPLRIEGVIGFDDPSLTGQALGLATFLNGFIGAKTYLSGNFQEKECTIDAQGKGRTSLMGLLFPFVLYVIKKPIWIITKKLIWKK